MYSNCKHEWKETGEVKAHAFTPVAIYVKCNTCNQIGFKIPRRDRISSVVYTWDQSDLPTL